MPHLNIHYPLDLSSFHIYHPFLSILDYFSSRSTKSIPFTFRNHLTESRYTASLPSFQKHRSSYKKTTTTILIDELGWQAKTGSSSSCIRIKKLWSSLIFINIITLSSNAPSYWWRGIQVEATINVRLSTSTPFEAVAN